MIDGKKSVRGWNGRKKAIFYAETIYRTDSQNMKTLKNNRLLIIFLAVAVLLPVLPGAFFWRAVMVERADGEQAFRELIRVTDELDAQGRYDAAAAMADRHLEILGRTFTRHRYLAMTMAQLGKIYYHQHRPLPALEMFRQAEAMMDELRLRRSPEMIRVYLDILTFYVGQRQYDAAVRYGEKTLALMKRFPTARTPAETADFMKQLNDWQRQVAQH